MCSRARIGTIFLLETRFRISGYNFVDLLSSKKRRLLCLLAIVNILRFSQSPLHDMWWLYKRMIMEGRKGEGWVWRELWDPLIKVCCFVCGLLENIFAGFQDYVLIFSVCVCRRKRNKLTVIKCVCPSPLEKNKKTLVRILRVIFSPSPPTAVSFVILKTSELIVIMSAFLLWRLDNFRAAVNHRWPHR